MRAFGQTGRRRRRVFFSRVGAPRRHRRRFHFCGRGAAECRPRSGAAAAVTTTAKSPREDSDW